MKSRISYPVKVFACGFIVLASLSLASFWSRWLCQLILFNKMPSDAKYVQAEPSTLFPDELENDPNVVHHSRVHAGMEPEAVEPLLLGIVDYFGAKLPEEGRSNIYYARYDAKDWVWIYFDEKIGQIACRYNTTQMMPDKTIVLKEVQLYVGPEGISETAEKSLGRFKAPIIDSTRWEWPTRPPRTIYDRKLRRFFNIDFNKRDVFKGPQLAKDDSHKPIQLGQLNKNPSLLGLFCVPPKIRPPEEKIKKGGRSLVPIAQKSPGPYLLVLDETGRIDLLDRQTLEFAGTAGHLPAPQTYFGPTESVTPKDLLAYTAFALALNTDDKYRGMCVASVCREGSALALAIYDDEGKLVRRESSKASKYDPQGRLQTKPSSRAVFFEVPWAPALTIAKYLTENLHPPLLSLVSYFTASSFEAGAGHRALFVLPNSFVAMKGRDIDGNIASRFFAALLIILPSIILAILLAWQVGKDATAVGLSGKARLCWLIGTIAFGLTAYITYRLTRPKITLVTCANCGRLRRPDMDRCHRCGSKWHIPELTPPTWRVIDS